jgi:hypothetical protein
MLPKSTVGIGHNRGTAWLPRSCVPPDATAVIRQPSRSAMTSARTWRQWLLSFERKHPALHRTSDGVDRQCGHDGADSSSIPNMRLCRRFRGTDGVKISRRRDAVINVENRSN